MKFCDFSDSKFFHLDIITVQIRKLRAETEREMPELVFKAFNCLRDFYLQVSDLGVGQIRKKYLDKLQENNP